MINFIFNKVRKNRDMSVAKSMKMKEYGTDVLSHVADVYNDTAIVRVNNNFRSSILD